MRMEAEVRIFTLNCWGLGMGISKNRDERMEDIGKYLADQNFDIVFLQVFRTSHKHTTQNFCFRKFGKGTTSTQLKH